MDQLTWYDWRSSTELFIYDELLIEFCDVANDFVRRNATETYHVRKFFEYGAAPLESTIRTSFAGDVLDEMLPKAWTRLRYTIATNSRIIGIVSTPTHPRGLMVEVTSESED